MWIGFRRMATKRTVCSVFDKAQRQKHLYLGQIKSAMKKFLWIAFLMSTGILTYSCSNDKLEPVDRPEACDDLQATFVKDLQPIIEGNCATAGCHASGSTFGDYSTYDNMLDNLNSGAIMQRSIEFSDMPPAGSPPLTEDEKLLLECWLLDGHPRN